MREALGLALVLGLGLVVDLLLVLLWVLAVYVRDMGVASVVYAVRCRRRGRDKPDEMRMGMLRN